MKLSFKILLNICFIILVTSNPCYSFTYDYKSTMLYKLTHPSELALVKLTKEAVSQNSTKTYTRSPQTIASNKGLYYSQAPHKGLYSIAYKDIPITWKAKGKVKTSVDKTTENISASDNFNHSVEISALKLNQYNTSNMLTKFKEMHLRIFNESKNTKFLHQTILRHDNIRMVLINARVSNNAILHATVINKNAAAKHSAIPLDTDVGILLFEKNGYLFQVMISLPNLGHSPNLKKLLLSIYNAINW